MQYFAIFPLRHRIALANILQRNKWLLREQEVAMTPGQRVRVRPASHLAQRKDAAAGEQGTVICCYTVRGRSAEKVDVRTASNAVLWGVSADEFELLETSSQTNAS